MALGSILARCGSRQNPLNVPGIIRRQRIGTLKVCYPIPGLLKALGVFDGGVHPRASYHPRKTCVMFSGYGFGLLLRSFSATDRSVRGGTSDRLISGSAYFATIVSPHPCLRMTALPRDPTFGFSRYPELKMQLAA
jgi:hypothetical protein